MVPGVPAANLPRVQADLALGGPGWVGHATRCPNCTPSPESGTGSRRRERRAHAPYSDGPTEGVNTKTKRIARQMHGRAGFTLLHHRILLG